MNVCSLVPHPPPKVVAALFVQRGSVGAHVGVLHADDAGTLMLLHQAWHHVSLHEKLEDCLADPEQDSLFWVPPGLDEDEQNDLRAHAVLVAKRFHEGGLPYAFAPKNAVVGPDGRVNLGESYGLTCATFVILLFKAAHIPLVDEATWLQRTPVREAEDRHVQEQIVDWLAQRGKEENIRQADCIAAEVGSVRIRAEEVAGASSCASRPINFMTAETLGKNVLAALANDMSASKIAKTSSGA